MRSQTKIVLEVLLLTIIAIASSHVLSARADSTVKITKFYVLEIKGDIVPVVYEDLRDALSRISDQEGSALILVIDTPGGHFETAKNIVSIIENSRIPVIGYVHPRGASAWSAGTLILLSTHVAAMSRGTIVGSCQPVMIDPRTGAITPVRESKILNAVSKYMEEAARMRGRNVTFARLCVSENLNLGAEEALRYGVVDIVADSIDELIAKLNGSTIGGVTYVVHDHRVERVSRSLRSDVMAFLSSPETSLVLLNVGIILLIVGALLGNPYVAAIGVTLLVLPLLSGVMPVNWLAVLLLLIGIGLIIGELLTGFGAHGALMAPGLIMAAIGGILMQPVLRPEEWAISISPVAATLTLYLGISACAIVMGLMLRGVISAYMRRPVSERLIDMVGATGVAAEPIRRGQTGYVRIHGEYWMARAVDDVNEGDRVVVIGREDGLLVVRKT